MFQQARPQSSFASALNILTLIYHTSVRQVRKSHRNAAMSILLNMLQTAIFVLAFYVMFVVLGIRGVAIRGDFMVYIMTGIFLYMTHTKTLGAVAASDGAASPMMQHAPMNTVISICAAAISTLYIQVLSLVVILFLYDVLFTPITINDPFGCLGMIMLSWFTGLAIGLVFLAAKPWAPTFIGICTTIYQRANMIASGKMFVANTLPAHLLMMFDWNPLFHTIDQSRGYAFVNYYPHNSSWQYALWVGIILLMLGLMGEFYTRRHVSASWSAKQ